MNWQDLQEEAENILNTKPSGGFEDVSFTTGTGGAPINRVGVDEIHRDNQARYNTTRHGWAYRGEVVVRCRKTAAKDHEGRTIYEAEDGTIFVYSYRPGSPEYFDSGALEAPKLR